MTNDEVTEDQVREALSDVQHPMIERSLIELGIVKAITVDDGDVNVLLAFPFPGIPIKEQLMRSVQEPLYERGLTATIETTVMDEGELNRFLVLERDGWKGAP